MRGFRAFLRGVLQAEVDRVHLQAFCDFVEHAFHGIGADRRARRAIGRDLGAVGDRRQNPRRAGSGCRRARSCSRPRRGSASPARRRPADRRCRARRHLAVLGDANLHRALRARGRAGRAHHFLARHHHLHRAAGFPRKQGRERFEIDDGLAAKAAADLGGDGADVALRDAGEMGRHRAHHELALTGAPDRGLAVGRHRDQAGMRLDIALMNGTRGEGALDDDVGLLETF